MSRCKEKATCRADDFGILSFNNLACFCVYDVIENADVACGNELVKME